MGNTEGEGEAMRDDCPIEEVKLTVPTVDDDSLQVLTFRVWVLGIASCLILSFLNMFFAYRKQQLTVSAYSAQILTLPLGRLMAAVLPSQRFRVPWTSWSFTLNHGPFNIKEHVLITIFANVGASNVFAVHFITILKAYYKRKIQFFVGFMVTLTTQLLGFGFAGIFRMFLVEPAHMWWPANLVQVSLFRTLHDREKRPKGKLTRFQFFMITLACSFSYYILPGYLFSMLSCISWICYIWPKSVLAHQLGSGLIGLGIGSIGLDWTTISGFLESPLASPFFATANVMVGFVISLYVLIPLSYWKFDLYGARRFPLISKHLFSSDGHIYNTTRVINDRFQLDKEAYNSYSKLHLSTVFMFTFGTLFATLTSTITHVLIFHGKEIYTTATRALSEKSDIHSRLMQKYKAVPTWWFVVLVVLSMAVSTIISEVYNDVLQLRWWGILLAASIGFIFTLPLGTIKATTNQLPRLYILTEFIIGYVYPGRPIANLLFRGYGNTSTFQAINLLSDFKLGHYMKIPPRSMFVIQVVGCVIASSTYLGVGWWLLDSIPNICNKEVLPKGSPWTCPHDTIYYDESIIWGLIGPQRIFGNLGVYKQVNWCLLVGAVAPLLVWVLRKVFPRVKVLRYIIMPVLLGGASKLPYASPVNYWSWFIVGFVFNYLVFKHHKQWWQRHNYVISGAMDAGVAFMAVFIYLFLDVHDKNISWWGSGLDDQCPLATCPTATSIHIKGCPVQ